MPCVGVRQLKAEGTQSLAHDTVAVSSVGIATGSIPGSVQTGSGAHRASYPMGTGGRFPWG
jgi:hypothetical protein